MLNIVRGDLQNKPEASKALALYFESVKSSLNGTLYLGYPIIGTAEGGFQIDALLVSEQRGLIAFHLIEGIANDLTFKDTQDDIYTKIQSKLLQYKDLIIQRKLSVPIHVITYAPAQQTRKLFSDPHEIDFEYPYLSSEVDLNTTINQITGISNHQLFLKVVSILQAITTIRKNKSRDYVLQENSRGAKLKNLEDTIANLDTQQSSAVIETVDGVQRIRGLAGSGKTIILALKVAYLHSKNPSWKIAVTFNTRSLKAQFKRLINMFVFEHKNEEPDWEKIHVIHAWGSPSEEGIYFNLCKEHNVEYIDFKTAKTHSRIYGEEFDYVCRKVLKQIKDFSTKYDVIVVDEAQDFSKEFLQICYRVLVHPKRLIYAYDELQSLNKKVMDSPEKIFGLNSDGKPLVTLKNELEKPKEDIILFKCYRNPLEILTTAHALGFGIYRTNGLVQMFDYSKLWTEIGYSIESGSLEDGHDVILVRDDISSPDFLSNHSPKDDILQFHAFESNEEQVKYIVNSIIENLHTDELKYDDIVVINANPLSTREVVGIFRDELYSHQIRSNLAGVSTSPDVFYEDNAITFTGIYRAKGNEAAMVYVINAHECFQGKELASKRNILFTAMTRSKAWVRVCGYGSDMKLLTEEYKQVKHNNFKLKFKYPTKKEREHMNIINRDMSIEEKKALQKNERSLYEFISSLDSGKIKKEDVNPEILEKLKKMINNH